MDAGFSFIIWMQETFGATSRPFWDVITNLGSVPIVVASISLAFWLKGTRFGLRLAVITTFGLILMEALKVLIAQPRPYYVDEAVQPWRDSDSFGMPSGHASTAVTVWGSLAVLLKARWLTLPTLLLIVLIGLSRTYFGVHSLAQVIAGWVLGLVLLFGVIQLERPFLHWFRRFNAWTQVGMALGVTILLLGFKLLVVSNIAATFTVPEAWTARYQAAIAYEAARDGKTAVDFAPLPLFDSFGADEIGLFLGIALVGIYVLHRGGFEVFTRREQVVNIVIGILSLVVLLSLRDMAEIFFALAICYWVLLPLVLGLGIPAVSRWGVARLAPGRVG